MDQRPTSKKLLKREEVAVDHFVHTPAETASNYVRFAEDITKYNGITWGCQLDDHIIPLRPGRKLGLLARPGHGKTTLGGYMVKREAQRIIKDGEQGKRYAAHISWEQSVEELEAMYQESTGYGVTDVAWGRVPIDTVVKDSLKRPALPVWIFGDSLYKSTLDTPPMTVEAVYNSIQGIWKTWGMMPSVLFFDYIQDIPVPQERDRYMQVSSAMRLVSRLAIQVQCPVIVGIQANQRTDDKATPIPSMRDAEWSAVIGQKLDVLLSLWRPIRTHLVHENPTIDIGGNTYDNTESLLAMKLLKQRFEKGYGIFAQRFDPNQLTLKDYRTVQLDTTCGPKTDEIPF